jgi:hypothetical protein
VPKRKPTKRLGDPVAKSIFDAGMATDLFQTLADVEAELAEQMGQLATETERDEGRIHRTGIAAAAFMEEAIEAWTRSVEREPVWSPAKGLYVSRRTPLSPFSALMLGPDARAEHLLQMTAGTERLLNVSFGKAPHHKDPISIDWSAQFPLTDGDVSAYFRRVLRTAHLWMLHNTARIVGKGCGVSFAIGELPGATPDADLRAAMEIYDTRSGRATEIGIAGTKVWTASPRKTATTIAICAYRGFENDVRVMPPTVQADIFPNEDPTVAFEYLALCEVSLVDLAPLGELTRQLPAGSPWYSQELPALLALLFAIDASEDTLYGCQLRRFGYLRMDRAELFGVLRDTGHAFRRFLVEVLPSAAEGDSASPRNVLRTLLNVEGQIWPVVDGPVIRLSPDGWLLVDLVTATRRLVWFLAVAQAGGGEAGTIRGFHFERVVQEEIDRLGFGPRHPSLRALRGKDLKRDGDTITDIDAVAELGDGTVLCVQAKSYPYSVDYGAGRFKAVRGMTTKVIGEAAEWLEKFDRVVAVRTASNQNYELPPAAAILPVIVTPFAAFLPLPECVEEVMPGLRKFSSLSELSEFLESQPSPTQ